MARARALARIPIAWPTLMLAAASFAIWIGGAIAFIGGSPAIGILMATVGAYLSFTPMHDASHQSVSKHKPVNAIIGRVCAVPLFAPFEAFRYVHLEHHKHTNDPEKDPDHYSGRGPVWLLPLRWVTQDLHYYSIYLRAGRSRRELTEVVLSLSLMAAIAGGVTWAGYGWWVLFGWLLPSRLALVLLACAFDYLPHRPHTVLGRVDRYRATSMRPTPWLSAILVFQNYHLIHHLFPGVPFYRYPLVWKEKAEMLRKKGAHIIEPSRT